MNIILKDTKESTIYEIEDNIILGKKIDIINKIETNFNCFVRRTS